MRSLRPLLIPVVVLLLAGCLPTLPGASTPGERPTPTPTQGLAGGEHACGRVRYTYTIDQGDLYHMEIEQEIPFDIWIDPGEPKEATILTGTVEGTETVRIQGLDQGVPCHVTITYGVTFEVNGVFTPQDLCKLELSVNGASAPGRISTTTTCSVMPQLDEASLFIAPYSGPFELRSPYPTLTEHPYNAANTVVVELLELVTPVSVGCTAP